MDLDKPMSKNFPDEKMTKYGFHKVLVSVGGYPAKLVYKYESPHYIISPLSDGSWNVISKKLMKIVKKKQQHEAIVGRVNDEKELDDLLKYLLTHYGYGAIIEERNDLSLLKHGSCY